MCESLDKKKLIALKWHSMWYICKKISNEKLIYPLGINISWEV